MRNLLLGTLALLFALPATSQTNETILDPSYYERLKFKVVEADGALFEKRVLPEPGSPCGELPGGFSVAFYYGGLRYLVTYECELPGVFASANGFTYADADGDGRIDVVNEEDARGSEVVRFYDYLFAPPVNLERRAAYQREFESVLKKLDAVMGGI